MVIDLTGISLSDVGKWGSVVTAVATAIGLVARFLIKFYRADKKEAAIAEADVSIYKKLQDEISRLERIIIRQQDMIGSLELQLEELRTSEIDMAVEYGALTAIVEGIPCGNCLASPLMVKKLNEVVGRIVERWEGRREALESTVRKTHAAEDKAHKEASP